MWSNHKASYTHTHTQAQPQLLAWDEQPQPPSRLAPFITWPPEKPSLDTIPPAHHHTEKKRGGLWDSDLTSDHHLDASFNAISHKLQLCPMQPGGHLSDGEHMPGAVTTDHVYTARFQGLPIQEPFSRRGHREVHGESDLTTLHCLHRLQRCLYSQHGDCRVSNIKGRVGDR